MSFNTEVSLEKNKLPGYAYSDVAGSILCANNYLLKGMLNQGDVAILFGESGCMKSFVSTDIAFHVATGKHWHGHRVGPNPSGVMVVLGEGTYGYPKRIKALQVHHNVDVAPIWVVPEPVSLMDGVKQLRTWIHQAELELGVNVNLLIMDTFSLMLGDGDESSNSDVSLALNNLRKAADGRSVLLIHHTGHSNNDRERGAYQIRGNADVRILVKLDPISDVVTLSCLKSKDEKPFEPIHLGYEVVEIATDEDNEPVTSLVLVKTDSLPNGNPRAKAKALVVIEQAIAECGIADREILKAKFYSLYSDNLETNRRAFRDGWRIYCEMNGLEIST